MNHSSSFFSIPKNSTITNVEDTDEKDDDDNFDE